MEFKERVVPELNNGLWVLKGCRSPSNSAQYGLVDGLTLLESTLLCLLQNKSDTLCPKNSSSLYCTASSVQKFCQPYWHCSALLLYPGLKSKEPSWHIVLSLSVLTQFQMYCKSISYILALTVNVYYIYWHWLLTVTTDYWSRIPVGASSSHRVCSPSAPSRRPTPPSNFSLYLQYTDFYFVHICIRNV